MRTPAPTVNYALRCADGRIRRIPADALAQVVWFDCTTYEARQRAGKE